MHARAMDGLGEEGRLCRVLCPVRGPGRGLQELCACAAVGRKGRIRVHALGGGDGCLWLCDVTGRVCRYAAAPGALQSRPDSVGLACLFTTTAVMLAGHQIIRPAWGFVGLCELGCCHATWGANVYRAPHSACDVQRGARTLSSLGLSPGDRQECNKPRCLNSPPQPPMCAHTPDQLVHKTQKKGTKKCAPP